MRLRQVRTPTQTLEHHRRGVEIANVWRRRAVGIPAVRKIGDRPKLLFHIFQPVATAHRPRILNAYRPFNLIF